MRREDFEKGHHSRIASGVGSAWCKRDLTALLALDASKNIDRVDTD